MRAFSRSFPALAILLSAVVWAPPSRGSDPTATPTKSTQSRLTVPDVTFKEVQISYPAFNRSFRLVPLGGSIQTSVFRLIEDPNVPQGTSLGPNEPNGNPGPVATRSCKEPMKATLRVWVSNISLPTFNASTTSLGLTGHVDADSVSKAFGKVAGGADVYFEEGAFSLLPGVHTAKLELNSTHGDGEVNFTNNVLESRFEIVCSPR